MRTVELRLSRRNNAINIKVKVEKHVKIHLCLTINTNRVKLNDLRSVNNPKGRCTILHYRQIGLEKTPSLQDYKSHNSYLFGTGDK